MLKQLVALSVIAAATTVFAAEMGQVEKSVVLSDGSTVYIFKDGKMAMEDKLGRVQSMDQGQAMQTSAGQSIRMAGNESARLDWILKSRLGGR